MLNRIPGNAKKLGPALSAALSFASGGVSPGSLLRRVPGALMARGRQVIYGGFLVKPFDNGTVSAGTFTPDALNGQYQFYTNNGAHTFAAPTVDCAYTIKVTNGASAGAITFSGFTIAAGNTGDALTTTNGHKFHIMVCRINGDPTYIIKALQ